MCGATRPTRPTPPRCSRLRVALRPVRVKSIEQQALQALHRTRSLWQADRTRRINTPCAATAASSASHIALGARLGLEQIARVLAEPRSGIPELLRPTMVLLLEEVRLLEARIAYACLRDHAPYDDRSSGIPGHGAGTTGLSSNALSA